MCLGLPAFEPRNLTVEFDGIVFHQFKIFHERVSRAVLVPITTGGTEDERNGFHNDSFPEARSRSLTVGSCLELWSDQLDC
jgi:hypothetical protein